MIHLNRWNDQKVCFCAFELTKLILSRKVSPISFEIYRENTWLMLLTDCQILKTVCNLSGLVDQLFLTFVSKRFKEFFYLLSFKWTRNNAATRLQIESSFACVYFSSFRNVFCLIFYTQPKIVLAFSSCHSGIFVIIMNSSCRMTRA